MIPYNQMTGKFVSYLKTMQLLTCRFLISSAVKSMHAIKVVYEIILYFFINTLIVTSQCKSVYKHQETETYS